MTKKTKKDREMRSFPLQHRMVAGDDGSEQMIVEGLACVFDQPTELFEFEGVKYYEQIDRQAFEGADMSDVIFNYNHGGKVLARLRNDTLSLDQGDAGLFIKADLSGTAQGRELFEEIKGGYIDRMSFAFTVAEEAYDLDTHTRKIMRIKKLYDVSAVDIPAYDNTSISARENSSVVYDEFKALEQAAADERRRLQLQIEIAEAIHS